MCSSILLIFEIQMVLGIYFRWKQVYVRLFMKNIIFVTWKFRVYCFKANNDLLFFCLNYKFYYKSLLLALVAIKSSLIDSLFIMLFFYFNTMMSSSIIIKYFVSGHENFNCSDKMDKLISIIKWATVQKEFGRWENIISITCSINDLKSKTNVLENLLQSRWSNSI